MIQSIEPTPVASSASPPRLWGLEPTQLHDRFWAARGVQVVRQGEPSQIVKHAELFLLTDADTLAVFKIGHLVERLAWMQPDVLFLRVHDTRDHGCLERVVTDSRGRFLKINRVYGAGDRRVTRVALTPDRRVAEAWQNGASRRFEWRALKRRIPRSRRLVMSVEGNLYDRNDASAVVQCLKDLVQVWQSLDATIHRARRVAPGVWSDTETKVEPSVRFIGPAWIGAGRDRLESPIVIGPALIWDARDREPASSDLEWQEIEPRPAFERPVRVRRSSFYRITKRAFDTVFAAAVLLFVLPLFPIVMLAIWLEDGRPFFFVHRRETVGGREFPCIKFRSMRKDADAIKADLAQKNRADGPQFFIDPDDDPRLTKVGGLLRKLNLDELPQFLNVLAGQMSVVGPRPSPRSENQCCPPWREARLSVRPGITGLWQMMRTRQQGLDFQEWIKYDIEYVETAGWRLDLWIIWKTVLLMLRLGD